MNIADFLVEQLIEIGCTEAFGIPGAVILEFIYAVERKKNTIHSHLCYHEQAAAFAACGYAQVSGKMGIAYATKGPGITNMITGIAEAYTESIPVLFITAHTDDLRENMRICVNQEIDIVKMVKNITKYAYRIDYIDEARERIIEACNIANESRKGPVLLDFNAKLFSEDISGKSSELVPTSLKKENKSYVNDIIEYINVSERPVILVGAGIRQSGTANEILNLIKKFKIPVLSSRGAVDCVSESDYYYGYIGSRGIRYSNFILSKADTIISLGNRLAYSSKSKSFNQIMMGKRVIRIDVDSEEFSRKIPNCIEYEIDLKILLKNLLNTKSQIKEFNTWIKICDKLQEQLYQYDINNPVMILSKALEGLVKDNILVSDVGNNALWVSRAYIYMKSRNRLLQSNIFSSLGSALCKAIGAYYASKKRVICFIGDQGLQMNIQELAFVAYNQLPIVIFLINNKSSGMIRNWEQKKYKYDLHTTYESGYMTPDFSILANSYGIRYYKFGFGEECYKNILGEEPYLIECVIEQDEEVYPFLKKGHLCQQLSPEIPKDLYDELEKL